MPYSPAYQKFSHKLLQCAKKSNARAWGRLQLLPASSPFSWEGLAGGPVRCTDSTACPGCWLSDSSQVLSLCHFSGHRLTGYQVHPTNRAAAPTSNESGDGAYGAFGRPLARALGSLHTVVTCDRTFQMKRCVASKMSNNTWLEWVALPALRTRSDRLPSPCNGLNRCQTFLCKWWWCRWNLQASLSTCTWFFAHWSDLWENFSDARLYGIENELFYPFFNVHQRRKSEWISLKFHHMLLQVLG